MGIPTAKRGVPVSNNQILPSTTVERICAARDAALDGMREAISLFERAEAHATQAQEYANAAKGSFGHYFNDRSKQSAYSDLFHTVDAEKSIRVYREYVDAAVWTNLLNMTGMVHLMDRTAKEEFDKTLSSENVPEVTPDNVYATLESLLADSKTIFQRGLARSFSDLDRRFKSHDAFKLGSRVVLTNVFDSWGMVNYHSRMNETIMDIERVMAVLDGKEADPGALMRKINDERRNLGFGTKQSVTETEYFRVRCYKNGNAHLWFLRDDLVEKANLLLAEYYGEVLPDAQTADDTPDIRSKAGLPSKDLAFYPTPDSVVDIVLRDARYSIGSHSKVLEPSAGNGNMVGKLLDTGASVDAVEIHAGRAAEIRRRFSKANVMEGNFLTMPANPVYDYVVMNPPFYGTHWMEHVTHAFDFLKPGGRLIAILPVTAQVGETRKHETFREWASKHSMRFSDLPEGSFVESGTRINTVYLTLRK
jgi:hypothetical protein